MLHPVRAPIGERVSIQQFAKQPVMRLDFTGMGPEEIIELIPIAEERIRIAASGAPKALMTLTILLDAQADDDATSALKAFAQHNKPYVTAGAVVIGGNIFYRSLVSGVAMMGSRILRAFSSEDEAKRWLQIVDPANPSKSILARI